MGRIAGLRRTFTILRPRRGMPFHPTCLEVYKHVSRHVSSRITVDDLMNWYKREARKADFDAFPHNHLVKSCSHEHEWCHRPGTEWLTANPVFVPALPSIFQSAISKDPKFSHDSSAFPSRPSGPYQSSRQAHDLFLGLCPELQDAILSHLSSKDIASLRLVTRSFSQLPQSLFHKLVRSEMPWLWEIYDSTPPSFWVTVSRLDLKSREERRKAYNDELELQREVILEEMPAVYDEWRASKPVFDESIKGARKTGFEEGIDTQKLDWYQLYLGVTREFKEGALKGLRNRERIWKDVEEIIRRIKRCQGMNSQRVIVH
ncbi:hypothetical protein NHQ30_002600 [Ciborinia camelliae]|nr:hypothetical protein NHQ30_002600 [Ciborinia camelliae]